MSKLLLTAALLLLAAAPGGKVKLEWKLKPGQVAEYDVLDAKTNKPASRDLFLFPHELGKDGRSRMVIDRYADIPWHFLFSLPRDEVKPGAVWEHTAFFFTESIENSIDWNDWTSWRGPVSIKALHAKGRYTLKKIEKKDDEELALIDGAFEFFEIRRERVNNQTKLTITKNKMGTLSTSAAVSLARGVLVKGAFAMDFGRAQERVWDKDAWEIKDTRLALSQRIELKEVVELDREKMAKAIEARVKKAVDWLKKQQKAGGDFGFGRTTESDRVETNFTGLVLRALLASGLKADDDMIQKAARFVKGTSPVTPQAYDFALAGVVSRHIPGTPWTDHKIAELREAFKKNFPKDDFATVKAAADGLLARRNRKLGTWAAGEKQGADTQNPVTTMHACEGLFYAWLAGADIPSEVWKTLIDQFASTWTEADKEIELDLGYEDGYDLGDPKKVFPGSWRFNTDRKASGPGGPGDPSNQSSGEGGFCFTTLGVLEILAYARATYKVPDGQAKSIDTATRKGLAWIQAHYTLRSPPPPEAPWTVQRMDYLYTLMRVLTHYGVKTVAGSDWWLEGSYLLLRAQFDDGSWDSSGGLAVMDTACAILFLTRGSLRLK